MDNGDFENILEQALELVRSQGEKERKLVELCRLLCERVPHYDWVGFYLVSRAKSKTLILGPYHGAPTEHVEIPFGEGVCGSAAVAGETVVVDDVGSEENYLACSMDVKSEIVVPIFKDGELIGELDIDSHRPAAFGPSDRKMLSRIVRAVSELLPL